MADKQVIIMNDTNNTVVYRHRKPCGEVFYVGIGCKQRPYNTTPRNQFWANVVKKYGYEVKVVATCLSWSAACELEKLMILAYGRRDLGTGTLVNLTDGGEGVKGLVHSKETRQKMSAAQSGENAPWYGKKLSKETRRKMSAARMGENNHNYGKKLSKETRQKMSAVHKGQKHTEESKQKMSAVKQKLTFAQVQEIRHRYKSEKTSHRKLAAEYGVSQATISRIIHNETYVTPE